MPPTYTPASSAEQCSTSHDGEVLSCAFSPSSDWLVSGGWDGYLLMWDLASGLPDQAWRAADKPVTACSVSPDGARIYSGSMNGLFCEWDATTRERRSIYLAHPRPVSGITFSPDHKRLATSSWDGTIILAKIGKDRDRATLAGHKDIVTGCRFLPDNQSVLSWSHDGTMKLWEIKRAKQTASWQAHKDRVTAGDVSPDGRWFFSGSRDGHVVLWDARTQEEAASSTHERNEVVWCGFLPNAELVAYALSKGEVYYKSVPDLQTRRRHDFGEAILCAALPRSGQQLAVGTSDGRILFLAHDDLLEGALCVTPTESHESRPNFFDRLLGRKAVQRVLRCCCPICHRVFEISEPDKQTAVCPDCKRRLHLNEFTLPA